MMRPNMLPSLLVVALLLTVTGPLLAAGPATSLEAAPSEPAAVAPVSYTHLTLPTIYSV